MPSAIVRCNQDEAGHQTIIAPSMPCLGAAGPYLWKHSGIYATGPVKLTEKMDEIYVSEKLSAQEGTKWMESFFAYLWVILLYFSLESRLIPAVLELGQVRLFWNQLGQEFDSCHTTVQLEFGSLFQAV